MPAAAPSAPAPESGAPRARPALGAFRSERPPASGGFDAIVEEAPAPPPASPPPPTAVAPAVSTSASAPTRDELVLAWGDHVLPSLRPRARAVFQASHFVGTEGGVALLAMPNPGYFAQAEPLLGEVANALSAHFGARVTLRLVSDSDGTAGGSAGGAPSPAEPPDDEESFEQVGDVADDQGFDAPTGVALATDRLLRAFPGAEEVDQA